MSRNLHLVVALLLSLALSACSRQQSRESSEGPYADSGFGGDLRGAPGDPRVTTDGLTAEQTRPHETPAGSPDTGTLSQPVTPVGGNRAAVRTQLRNEASRLDGLVKSRQLAAAATSAMRVRDLAVSVGGKTVGLPRDNVIQIEHDISAITEITENLRLQATAGKPDGVKVQNDLLQPIVARVVRLSA